MVKKNTLASDSKWSVALGLQLQLTPAVDDSFFPPPSSGQFGGVQASIKVGQVRVTTTSSSEKMLAKVARGAKHGSASAS